MIEWKDVCNELPNRDCIVIIIAEPLYFPDLKCLKFYDIIFFYKEKFGYKDYFDGEDRKGYRGKDHIINNKNMNVIGDTGGWNGYPLKITHWAELNCPQER